MSSALNCICSCLEGVGTHGNGKTQLRFRICQVRSKDFHYRFESGLCNPRPRNFFGTGDRNQSSHTYKQVNLLWVKINRFELNSIFQISYTRLRYPYRQLSPCHRCSFHRPFHSPWVYIDKRPRLCLGWELPTAQFCNSPTRPGISGFCLRISSLACSISTLDSFSMKSLSDIGRLALRRRHFGPLWCNTLFQSSSPRSLFSACCIGI